MMMLGLLGLLGVAGVADGEGVGCDLAACSCANVSLAHLRDRVYTAPIDLLTGETVAVKICDAFTAEDLAALSPHCGYSIADNATAVQFRNGSCEILGAVQPCARAAGCGMTATKTVPSPAEPEVYVLTVRYEFDLGLVCVDAFTLDMTIANSLKDAQAAELGPVSTLPGATCSELAAPLAALTPKKPDPGPEPGPEPQPQPADDDDFDGNCTMPADRGPGIPPSETECGRLFFDDNCDTDGLVNYLSIYYCELGYSRYHLEFWRTVALCFILLWLFVLFMMLGSTADDFFSPALIVLSNKMDLSQRTAGVTLLALGNGAPDLFSVISSIHPNTATAAPEIGLALGDLTGGGNFVVTVVLSALLVVVRPLGLRAEGMFFRDALFYAGSVMFVYAVMLSGEVTLLSSLLFFGGYVGYCFVVIVVGPRTPPCLSDRRDEWRLTRAMSARSDLDAPLMAGESGDMSVNRREGGGGEQAERAAGLSAAEGQALLNSVLGETVDRIAEADVADIAGTATVLIEEAEKVQGMWMALTGWEEKGIAEKFIYMLEAPFTVMRWMSIPPVLYDTDDMQEAEGDDSEESDSSRNDGSDYWAHKLERPLTAMCLPGFTSFCMFYLFQAQLGVWPIAFGDETCDPAQHLTDEQAVAAAGCKDLVGDHSAQCQSVSHCVYNPPGMSVWLLVTLCSFVVIPPIVWKCTNPETRPPAWFKLTLNFFAFMSSMFWMDLVAGEAVAVLKSLGLMWDMDMAVLGLTVLAWGNSIGDLVADVSVARAGSPDMAVTACFAGPLFNMMVGLGVAFFVQCFYTVKEDCSQWPNKGGSHCVKVALPQSTWYSLHVSFIGLSSILCLTCLAAYARGFRLRFWWAFALGGYYCFYMIAEAAIVIYGHD